MKMQTEDRPLISVLIPTYMERENIASLFNSISNGLSGENYEIVVIDDNSPDGTADEVRRLSPNYGNIKLLVRPEKLGLGSAYKNGSRISSGDFIVSMDADLSHTPEDIPRLLKGLNSADIAIGSRYIKGGNIIGWSLHRSLISYVANLLARLLLELKVKDVTSGFRVYRKKAFEEIVKISNLNDYDFQIEALYIAKKLGFKVEEIPITFTDRKWGESKLGNKEIVKFSKSMFSMIFRRFEL